ncbi:MAG TPA: phage integrase N-terminal SAM-like domain-containing protein, partial [Prolixibacteraceae bacterium]|nr:phage integrase N-terminal SAM-like domain-containing protein [Prolixibacteraceae bacterium]
MKNQNSPFVERLIHEMQLRNYSSKTVNSYSSLLSKIESFYHLPFDQISTQQLKDYVLQRI